MRAPWPPPQPLGAPHGTTRPSSLVRSAVQPVSRQSSLMASLNRNQSMLSLKRLPGLVAVLCPIALSVFAQGWIEPQRPLPRGAIEKIRSAVQVAVTGRIARVTVEEWFRNSGPLMDEGDRKSTRLNSSHSQISYAVFCLKKKKKNK